MIYFSHGTLTRFMQRIIHHRVRINCWVVGSVKLWYMMKHWAGSNQKPWYRLETGKLKFKSGGWPSFCHSQVEGYDPKIIPPIHNFSFVNLISWKTQIGVNVSNPWREKYRWQLEKKNLIIANTQFRMIFVFLYLKKPSGLPWLINLVKT